MLCQDRTRGGAQCKTPAHLFLDDLRRQRFEGTRCFRLLCLDALGRRLVARCGHLRGRSGWRGAVCLNLDLCDDDELFGRVGGFVLLLLRVHGRSRGLRLGLGAVVAISLARLDLLRLGVFVRRRHLLSLSCSSGRRRRCARALQLLVRRGRRSPR